MENLEKTEEELKKIKDEVVCCKKCPLYLDRIKNKAYPVIGKGSHSAKIMFVGEAPGANEAKTGHPFCGAAGKVLDELLESVQIKKEKVYICNILKDRPPQNRNPQSEEIKACTPYLERQIKAIKPKAICALGNFATAFLMEKYGLKEKIQGISSIHGKIFESNPLFGSVIIIPLYHPAVATYNPNMKEVLKKDFKALNDLIK